MLENPPAYLVVGRGRWATLIKQILLKQKRTVAILENSRMNGGEQSAAYQNRLEAKMMSSGAAIAWLCVPFGPWVLTMAAAAMNAGLDVVAECPWLWPLRDSESLIVLQEKQRRVLGVHYEYCLLEQLQEWRKEFQDGEGCTFHGAFELSRAARHSLRAELQLGSHLLAIRRYAVPAAAVGQVRCSYQTTDRRVVWLTREDSELSRVTFENNRQPLIQRYIETFEKERIRRNLTFGLDFAGRVATDVLSLR
jgi:predicted dehydrogenase